MASVRRSNSGGARDRFSTTGPNQSTAMGEIVSVQVPLLGPYGLQLEPDELGKSAIIKSWERLPDGRIGPVQKHGGIRIGDVLIALNDTQLHDTSFNEVLQILRNDNLLKKTLHFAHREELLRRRGQRASVFGSAPAKSSTFMSQIKRARVNEGGRSPFAEYDVACSFRTMSMQLQREKTAKWTVWKRYSDFEKLDGALRKVLGWQIENISFPPKHTFAFNKLAPDFLDQRRKELDEYWQKVISLDRVTDFTKHHCNQDLKAFLEIDAVISGGGGNEVEESEEKSGDGSSSSSNSTSRGRGIRRQTSATRVKPLRAARGTGFGSQASNDYNPPPPPSPIVATVPKTLPATTVTPSLASPPFQPPVQPPSVYTPPPPVPVAAPTPSKPPPPPSSASQTAPPVPPKAKGARAALLADISKRRID